MENLKFIAGETYTIERPTIKPVSQSYTYREGSKITQSKGISLEERNKKRKGTR